MIYKDSYVLNGAKYSFDKIGLSAQENVYSENCRYVSIRSARNVMNTDYLQLYNLLLIKSNVGRSVINSKVLSMVLWSITVVAAVVAVARYNYANRLLRPHIADSAVM
ncbi:MAG: hypothetical protein PHW00_02815 [Clostridia bacterium]|nr:hypothetical protein [Clostridia bacterium]